MPFLPDTMRDERLKNEKKLLRETDLRIFPVIMCLYILNGVDRGSVAAGKVAGLQKDLGLSSVQFSTVISIFYVGYILFQVPLNIFLSKMGRPSIYLPAAAALWGTICLCQAATTSLGGLLTCRILLGCVEAAYYPGCLFLISSWYTPKELALRNAFFAASGQISGAFSGLMTAGIIQNTDGLRGIPAYRWIFIIEGSLTIFFAIVASVILPDFPANTKRWFTAEEREVMLSRLVREGAQDDIRNRDRNSFFHGLTLNLRDVNFWLLFLTTFSSAVSISTFFPSVVQTLGYGHTATLLLTSPAYMFALVVQISNSWHSDLKRERYFHVVWPPLLGIIGYTIAVSTLRVPARYAAFMLMVASETGLGITWAWASENLLFPPEKRAAALAALNSLNSAFSIWVPYTYLDSQRPRYAIAFSVDIALCVIAMISATILRIRIGKLNQRLDQEEYERNERMPMEAGTLSGKSFRYQL